MREIIMMLERELSNDGLIYISIGKVTVNGMPMNSLLFI